MSLKSRLHNYLYLQRTNNRNATAAQKLWKRIKVSLAIIFTIWLIVIYNSYPVQGLFEVLRAPNLPELQTLNSKGEPIPQYFSPQNWGGTNDKVSEDTQHYHHVSQGTATLSMPYDWFVSLEEPESSLWTTLFKSLFFMEKKPFAENSYLLRFGFIRGQADPIDNPDGLPIGFAKTESLNIAGLPVKTAGVGFTCAACHTGHFIADKDGEMTEFVIEGAPATTDLGQLTAAISASLGQTALSSQIPVFDGRFDRFAQRVLGKQYNAEGKATLAIDLVNLIKAAEKNVDIVNVQEGYGRLDALNRIGNQVFAKDLDRRDNYQPIDAPVNYPFIWTSSWFKWVQYDGSIMQPLVRNVGESMGVSSQLAVSSPEGEGKFQSSIPINNLVWLEEFLKGEKFNHGLQAPAWPFDQIVKADPDYQLGKALYENRCEGCHLPVVANMDKLQSHFKPIDYIENGQFKQTEEAVLDVKIISHKDIGTDPAQGNVLVNRILDTAGNDQGSINQRTNGVGIDGEVCGLDTNQVLLNQWPDRDENDSNTKGSNKKETVNLINGVNIKDGGNLGFAFALGAIVDQTIKAWYAQNLVTDPELIKKLSGGRPNCLQAGQGYKARPLNGVWSTAPFLHNGSVPTIRDLICKSQEQRPEYVLLGDIRFDQKSLGLVQPENINQLAKDTIDSGRLYTDEGYFILDTNIPGNKNIGHNFSDEYDQSKSYYDQKSGVIGIKFSDKECDAILDYIKTI